MTRVGSPIPVRLSRRMCLSCGYDGAVIQSDHRESGWLCPHCHADLYARPPRSYADLEGLDDTVTSPRAVRQLLLREAERHRGGWGVRNRDAAGRLDASDGIGGRQYESSLHYGIAYRERSEALIALGIGSLLGAVVGAVILAGWMMLRASGLI